MATTSDNDQPRPDFSEFETYGDAKRDCVMRFERKYIRWLLDKHDQNLSNAARSVHMDRKHLHDLAVKHGLRNGRG